MPNLVFDRCKATSKKRKRVVRCALRYPEPRKTFVENLQTSEEFALEVFDQTDASFLDQAYANLDNCWRQTGNGRYSDGTFSVVYTAESEDVAVTERAYHFRRIMPQNEFDSIHPGFFIYEFRLIGDYEDYSLCTAQNIELVAPYARNADGLDYHPFCAELAKEARARVDFIVVPSARKLSGVCIPVLREEAVVEGSVRHKSSFAFAYETQSRGVKIDTGEHIRSVSIDDVATTFTCETCATFVPLEETGDIRKGS